MGDQNGDLDEFDGTNALLTDHGGSSPVTSLSITPSQTWTAATHDSLLNSQNEALQIRGKNILAIGDARIQYSSSPAIDFTGISTVALFDDNTFSVFDAATLTDGVEYHVNANVTGSFAIADVNGDGQEDILIGTDNGLYAYNWNGVPLENFPLKALDGGKIAGSPIVVGLIGSSSVGIIFGSSNGQIYGYDGTGKTLNGFPLQTGGVVSSVAFAGNLLAAASTDSSIYVWRVNNILDSSQDRLEGISCRRIPLELCGKCYSAGRKIRRSFFQHRWLTIGPTLCTARRQTSAIISASLRPLQ